MITFKKTYLFVAAILLVVSCGKEELEFNPEIDENSSFNELLKATSFFDRKETTFIIQEDEYSDLLISRDTSNLVFKTDEIFDNMEEYTHLTYPVFSKSFESFFKGEILSIERSSDQISISYIDCDFNDLYDDFLINTSLPNGHASTRNDIYVNDLSNINTVIETGFSPFSDLLETKIKTKILESRNSPFIIGNEVNIEMRGTINGIVTLLVTPRSIGIDVKGFELQNYGFELSFAEPNCDFPRLRKDLSDDGTEDSYFEAFRSKMSSQFVTNESFAKQAFVQYSPMAVTPFGNSVGVSVGINWDLTGDFIWDYIYEINTTKVLDLQYTYEFANPLSVKSKINGITGQDLSQFLTSTSDSYIGAQAGVIVEPLVGFGVGDPTGTFSIGLLSGVREVLGIRGQTGHYNGEKYVNGCVSEQKYITGNVYASNKNINWLASSLLGVPNTAELFDYKAYDLIDDPNFVSDKSIKYTSICLPDLCKEIDENESFVKVETAENGMINVDYLIVNSEGNVGTFDIKMNTPTISETILKDGNYGVPGQFTTTLDDDNIRTAILTQDEVNLWTSVFDNFNECEKTLPYFTFSNECDDSEFIDDNTGLRFRRYNIENEADEILFSGTCLLPGDAIWTSQNEFIGDLFDFEPDHQTINYMSYDRCQCYAEKLSAQTSKNYAIPTKEVIQSFIDNNQNKNFSLVGGGNEYCSNFIPSGYAPNNTGCMSGSTETVDVLLTNICLTSTADSYFHVDPNVSNPLNRLLFGLTPSGDMFIKEIPKTILAPCRLQIIN